MRNVKLVVVIPVGPACEIDNISDTIDSIVQYVTPSHAIIVLDDSKKGSGEIIKERFSDVTVLKSTMNHGKNASLYFNLSKGFSYAYENYDFEVLLKMDTDALMIGKNPEIDAIEYFRQHQEIGIIGSYRIHMNGNRRDFSWPRNILLHELSLSHLLKHPRMRYKGWFFLHKIYNRSRREGYELGEHCMGGAYFVSRDCIRRLYENNLFARQEMHSSKLEEDQIFGLLMYSTGLRHGDFGSGSYPMGLRQKGLPCSPEDLLKSNKKITHSTRFFENLSERSIREFFKQRRLIDKI